MLVLLVSATAAVVLGSALGWRLVHTRRSPAPRTLEVSTRGRSADDALVKVTVRADLHLTPSAGPDTRSECSAALQAALRDCLANRRLMALPGSGDDLDLAVQVPGATLGRVQVVQADVEVTRELRRLVGGP